MKPLPTLRSWSKLSAGFGIAPGACWARSAIDGDVLEICPTLVSKFTGWVLGYFHSIGDANRTLRGILQGLPPQEFAQLKVVLHLRDWLASAKIQQATVLFLRYGSSAIGANVCTLRASLRQFQKQVQKASSNVLWLRAPTGTGKIEALLFWADNTERFLYLLPTQATINAMGQRLQKIYGKDAVALAHGCASYMLVPPRVSRRFPRYTAFRCGIRQARYPRDPGLLLDSAPPRTSLGKATHAGAQDNRSARGNSRLRIVYAGAVARSASALTSRMVSLCQRHASELLFNRSYFSISSRAEGSLKPNHSYGSARSIG